MPATIYPIMTIDGSPHLTLAYDEVCDAILISQPAEGDGDREIGHVSFGAISDFLQIISMAKSSNKQEKTREEKTTKEE